jgi:TPR repeat protein
MTNQTIPRKLLSPLAGALLIGLGLAVAPAAHAQGEARDLALDAFEVEFFRHQVAMPPDELSAAFALACEKGYSAACSRVSWLDDAGRPDLQEAREVMLPSCDAGEPVACMVVGWAEEATAAERSGSDAERYIKRAARNYKVHCDGGFDDACHDYARVLYDYPFLGADPRAAVKRWQEACYAGVGPSCTSLGVLYRDGGRGVKPNSRSARDFGKRGCDAGDPQGCALVAGLDDAGWDAAQLDATYGDLCTQGHRDSCWRLARTYFDGIHPEPSEGRTFELFERACDLGHARACFESGRHFGEGQSTDDDKAAAYYERACDLGAPAGCAAQVDMILADRVEGSVKGARAAFEMACEDRESLPACSRLAYALIEGVEVPRDAERGKKLLHRVCFEEGSDPTACASLGQVYEEGLGGDRDRTEASKFYRWACSSGHIDSCMARGYLLLSDVGVRRDDHEALHMFQRACEGGVAKGCFEAGYILEEATFVTKDLARAAEFFDEGCQGGSARACAGLGRVRELGIDGSPDMAGAREAYEAAVALDNLESKRRLARLLWNGFGGKKDKKRAKQLSSDACQNGDPVACRGPAFL